jgi:peptide-methionine (S)-S-oxide reductase
MAQDLELATIGGGCFWCVEAVLEQLNGVSHVVSGYSGGHVENPTYEQVCGKQTGHAEVIQVHFDPKVLSFANLLEAFFASHDPTTPNRQGNDVGPQYRSVIYYHSAEQKQTAEQVIQTLNAAQIFPGPIVTEVAAFKNFYAAEDYHQGYYRSHPYEPYCAYLITPKLAKFRKVFASKMKA